MGWRDVETRLGAQVSPADQAARDVEALQIKRAELANATDPVVKAALTREITRDTANAPSSGWRAAEATMSQPVPLEPVPPVPIAPSSPVQDPTTSANAGTTFANNVGGGLSMGLDKYATAGMVVGADYLRNLGTSLRNHVSQAPTISYADALRYTRDEKQAEATEHPIAAVGGQLLGGATLAGLTGNAGALGLVGRGAVQGGVQGLTENNYTTADQAVQDAALGAGLGAVGGGIGAGVGAVAGLGSKAFIRNQLVRGLETSKADLSSKLTDARQYLSALNSGSGPKSSIKLAEDAVQKLSKDFTYISNRVDDAKTVPLRDLTNPRDYSLGGRAPDKGPGLVPPPLNNPTWLSESRLPKQQARAGAALRSLAGQAVTGAALGAGSTVFTGRDPVQDAIYGTIGLPATLLGGRVAGLNQLGKPVADLISNSAARGALHATKVLPESPVVRGALTAATVPPAVNPKSRLQELADLIRSHLQGTQ